MLTTHNVPYVQKCIRYVFKDNPCGSIFRTLAFDELSKCKKESTSCSVKPSLAASDRNILTRESSCPQVCSGEICGGDFCDVGCIPFILLYIVNGSVTAVGILINLTMPHTAHPA